jgi:plasmid rolling circle replication initiator protein Rep
MTKKEKPLSNDALAGEFEKGSGIFYLPKRIERYGNAKARQIEILTHVKEFVQSEPLKASLSNLDATQHRIQDCGNYLVFNNYYTVDDVRLSKASFCMKHLLCPLCAIRRGAKQVQAYLEKFELLRNDNPRLKPYMLTLTVKNGHDLAERFEHLTKSVRKLLKRRRDAKDGKGSSELLKALGGVFSYELTLSKHGWHPHVHMVILCDQDNPIEFSQANAKNSKLSKEWHAVTGDSFIVDVRPIQGDPAEGFIEVFKYALKFSDLSPQENLAAYLTLKARRLTGSFGLFWGVQVPDTMTDNLLDELPYIEMFYKYTKAGYSLTGTREGAPVGKGSEGHEGKSCQT